MNYKIEAPPMKRNNILVFDVETTGLLPRKPRGSIAPIPISEYPHIIQLSFALYDVNNKSLIRSYDSYVKMEKTVVIGEYVSKLTGITNEICNNKGNDIMDVLKNLHDAYTECDVIVAHNIDFDEKMVLVEIERNREQIINKAPECMTLFNKLYEQVNGLTRYCTMRKGTTLCNIMSTTSVAGRPPSLKWPKLAELYAKLFTGEIVDGMHNSMVDVLACLRCYLQMRHNSDIGYLTLEYK